MEYINNRLCISHDELTDTDNGVMTKSQYVHYKRKGRLECLRRGFYAVDSLPTKYAQEVRRRNPDMCTTAKQRTLTDVIELDGAAHTFYSAHTFDSGKHLPPPVADEYAANASILNAFRNLLTKAASQRGRLGDPRLKITEFWKDKADVLPLISEQMPNTLPTYFKNLQRLFNRYTQEGYPALISPKYGNRNASKFKCAEQEAVAIRLLGDHRNLDNEQVAKIYNHIAKKMDWDLLTGRAFGYLRQKHGLTIAAATRGLNEFNNTRTMQAKRSLPTAPLLFWTADGWDVELHYQASDKDDNGRRVTTYNNRLTMVVVLDPFNNYPVGYAIGERENSKLIRAAMQNAMNHTRELFGTRYRTNQLQTDHYALPSLTPLYGVIADKVTPARVKNAKAKPVEPYFNYLNKKYFQLQPNWSGFGITSQKSNQPNYDMLDKIKHSFPDEDGCRQQIIAIMEMERASKVADYMAGFANVPAERLLPLTDEAYLLNFGATTGHKNAIEGNGLLPTINGVRRAYDCFNPQFREFAHLRWTVMYDEADLSKALAVNEDGTLRFMLESKYVQPMALADRKEGDADELARIRQFNKGLTTTITNRLAEAHESAERLMLEHPDLHNSYAKAIICDSRGQHKDQRNRQRRALNRTSVNVEAVEVKLVEECAPAVAVNQSIYDLY